MGGKSLRSSERETFSRSCLRRVSVCSVRNFRRIMVSVCGVSLLNRNAHEEKFRARHDEHEHIIGIEQSQQIKTRTTTMIALFW